MKDTRRTKLILRISLVVSFLILTVISAVTLEQFRSIPSGYGLVVDSYKIQSNLQQLYTLLLEAENAQRTYLLSGNEEYIIKYREKKTAIDPILDSLDRSVSLEDAKRKHFVRLDSLVHQRIASMDRVLLPSSTEQNLGDLLSGLEKNSMLLEEIKKLIEGLKNTESYETGLHAFSNQQKGTIHLVYLLVEMIFSLGVFTVAFIILKKNLEKQEVANRDLKISNTIFKQVEKISDSGHWHYRPDDKRLHFSTNLYQLLGYEPDSFEPDWSFVMKTVHKDDRRLLIQTIRKVQEIEDTFTIEFRYYQSTGTLRTFRMMVCLMNDEFHQKVIIGANLDVTDETEDHRKLERLFLDLKLQNTIFKNAEILADTGSYSCNHTHHKTEFSDNLYRILGYTPNSIEPSATMIIKATDDGKEKNQTFSNEDLLALIEEHGETPIKITKPDGSISYLATKKKQTREAGEDICIITFKDVTQELHFRNTLEDKNKELSQTIKELDSFNHIASHDLQEPLRKIQTFASKILSGPMAEREPKDADYLLRIQNSASRMQKLINDLLSLTRITKGEKVSTVISLNQLLEESIKELMPDLLERKSVLSYTILPEADVIPFQIRQLFDNLISNAIKYSKSEEPLQLDIKTVPITDEDIERFKLSKPKNYIKIAFIDNGIGFENSYAESIFSPFKRLHNRSEYTGTGIGLSICRKVMENHNGFIYATSIPENGASFFLIFARKKSQIHSPKPNFPV